MRRLIILLAVAVITLFSFTANADCTGVQYSFALLNQETFWQIFGAVQSGSSDTALGMFILEQVANGNAVMLQGARFTVVSSKENLVVIKLSDGRVAVTADSMIRCK